MRGRPVALKTWAEAIPVSVPRPELARYLAIPHDPGQDVNDALEEYAYDHRYRTVGD